MSEGVGRVDIVKLIGAYTALTRSGKVWRGHCPLHPDRANLFTVDTKRNMYYCFGCKAGGTAIGFLMAVEHIDFATARKRLEAGE